MMKSLQFFAPAGLENLKLRDVPDPGQPAPDEIRVRILASSLNGHDYNVAVGRLPVRDGRILLTDGAGIVEAVGSAVTEFSVGQSVVSTFFPDWRHGIAPVTDFSRTPGDGIDGHGVETVVRPAAWYTRVPYGWSMVQAATLPTAGLTAWRAIAVEGAVRPGDTVLVLGTGGVSLFALQFAKRMGARVIVTTSSDEKCERALQYGADAAVNYRAHTDWGAEVRRLTDGAGVDVVVETGGPGTLPQSIIAASTGARIVLVGVLTGIQGVVPTVALMAKQIQLYGITVGHREAQLAMIRALDTMGILPIVDNVFPLDEIVAGFRHQESGRHFGKIGIEI
jgi:NADPH:quinone reductase-like Zn-dependent oxidoreductase